VGPRDRYVDLLCAADCHIDIRLVVAESGLAQVESDCQVAP
jgi:hypothetical protein